MNPTILENVRGLNGCRDLQCLIAISNVIPIYILDSTGYMEDEKCLVMYNSNAITVYVVRAGACLGVLSLSDDHMYLF